jgi:hypothetical protein
MNNMNRRRLRGPHSKVYTVAALSSVNEGGNDRTPEQAARIFAAATASARKSVMRFSAQLTVITAFFRRWLQLLLT